MRPSLPRPARRRFRTGALWDRGAMPSTASAVVLPVLLLVVGLGLGAVLGYALAVARSASARAGGRDAATAARADAAQWRARAEELAERAQLAEERSERDGSVLRALAPVRTQLEQVGSRVEAMERDRAASLDRKSVV